MPRLTLVSGPASSGKSRWAEHLAQRSGRAVVYVATGPSLPGDSDWSERLRRHRARRPPSWRLREVGAELTTALAAIGPDELALIDSLGTWVAALLERNSTDWALACDALLVAVRQGEGVLLLVAEECGWGVVPPTALGGRFRQRLGEIQQRLAAEAGASWLVLQGRAIDLVALGLPVPGSPADGFA